MVYRRTERVEERLQDKRDRILHAVRQVVGEVGFRDAQVIMVAEAAGVATGTVYRYFPSKGELFAEARKVAPAIIFIDEIDTIGRTRGANVFGGHDEREQTLNQILTEMDGFDSSTSVIVIGATKRDTLVALAGEFGLTLDETVAVGDGANDLPMLGAAGLGIAFHAKPAVAAASRWRVDHADLTALLYAQGYRAHEIFG